MKTQRAYYEQQAYNEKKKIKNRNTAKQPFLMVFCKSHSGSSSVHLDESIK